MNKYEENISDIITLDATKEIVNIFLEHAAGTDDNVGLIANKELIEYAMQEALFQDWINARKVDLELGNDIEYMIFIGKDGNLVVQPVTEYSDKYFLSMEYVYISMDGDIGQITIDNCINRDVNVVLFGYEDNSDEEDYTVNGQKVDKETFDSYVSKFVTDKVKKNDNKSVSTTSKENFKVNGKRVDKETYEKELAKFEDRYLDNIKDMLIKYAGFMDDWNDLLRLFY